MTGFVRLIPMLVCMGMIFFLSHQPGDRLDLSLFPGVDKVSHALAYGLLSLTVILAFSKEVRARRSGLVCAVAVLVPALYGISDEYHQSFIAGRSTELADLAADAFGALVVSSVWLFNKHRKANR
jgi:VanZ family protein